MIPVAGLGTRFLPATKTIPKEMLPIVDRPTIEYIVEEAIASGIEEIIMVTGRGKGAIEDHFDHVFELEESLAKREQFALLKEVVKSANIDIHYIRQKEPLGLGHAILCARKFVGNEPFAVMLGDDIIRSKVPVLAQLIQQFNSVKSSIIGVQEVADADIEQYGVIKPAFMHADLFRVESVIEKPKVEQALSNLAIVGRYILTPEIFTFLEKMTVGQHGEIQLTDAIEKLCQVEPVHAYQFQGERFDVGNQLGFIEANLAFSLEKPSLSEGVVRLMKTMLHQWSPKVRP